MARKAFDSETFATIVIQLFKAGRRTVSYHDILKDYDRELDADLTRKIVDAMPKVETLVERAGYPCTLVNAFCVRQYAEIPIQDATTARKCNVYRSGGKDPVGLRRAMPDDLVRPELHGTAQHLHTGGIQHAVQADIDDVYSGLTPAPVYAQHQRELEERLSKMRELEPTPMQQRLLPDDEAPMQERLLPEKAD